MTFDPYQILGVRADATIEEIRRAYRRSARLCHPDLGTSAEDAERFRNLTLAYEVLTDADKRALFEEFGEDSLRPLFDPARARLQRRPASDDQDRLKSVLGGTRRRRPSAPGPRDLDVVVPLRIDRRTAARGGRVQMRSPLGGLLTVELPPNVRTGTRIRLIGKGRTSSGRGRPGDLYCHIVVVEEG